MKVKEVKLKQQIGNEKGIVDIMKGVGVSLRDHVTTLPKRLALPNVQMSLTTFPAMLNSDSLNY